MIRNTQLAKTLYLLRIKSSLQLASNTCRLDNGSIPIRWHSREARKLKFSSDNIRKKSSSKNPSQPQIPYKKPQSSSIPNTSEICPDVTKDSSKLFAVDYCDVTAKCPPPLLSKEATPPRINKLSGELCEEPKCEVKQVCPPEPYQQNSEEICTPPPISFMRQDCVCETVPKRVVQCKTPEDPPCEPLASQKPSTPPPPDCPPPPPPPKECTPPPPSDPPPSTPPPPTDCQPPPPPPPSSSGGFNKWLLALLAAALALGGAAIIFLSDDEDSKKDATPGKASRKRIDRLKREVVKVPASAQDLPRQVQYLLVGGGTASFSAFRSIKSIDPKAQVLVITKESEFPYMRPPLSKEMWNSDQKMSDTLSFRQWNGTVRSVYYEPDSFYMDVKALSGSSKGGVAVARGWTVTCIDPVAKRVVLDDGTCISYDKCLLAPGSSPRHLSFLDEDPDVADRVFYFRDIFDYRDLSKDVEMEGRDVVVVGGGLLGCELASSLRRRNNNVTQVCRESTLLAKLLPQYLGKWLADQLQEEGVVLVSDSEVVSAKAVNEGHRLELNLSNGSKISCDTCVVAIGSEPDTSLAETSKLETDPKLGGYLVNPEMQARSNLYIAGDAACFFDERFGRRRIEHHDHAVVSGRLAGENMTGAGKPYLHQSMMWSDLSADVGWEGVGLLDPTLRTVGVFVLNEEVKMVKPVDPAESAEATDVETTVESTPQPDNFSKGVVFYLDTDGIIVGILLWNVFNRMQLARQILKQCTKYEDLNEVAKLFTIHED